MARRLKTIARRINDTWGLYEAKIERVFFNTDITPRYGPRTPKKGRYGNCLIVRRLSDGAVVFRHNSAETYRSNSEVEDWVKRVEIEPGFVPEPINVRW